MFEELGKILNLPVHSEKVTEKSGLPLYLSKREIYRAELAGVEFIIVSIGNLKGIKIKTLIKQGLIYSKKYGKIVVFSFNTVSKYQRDVLIGNNVPFICMPNQIYLPFLGMHLSNAFSSVNYENLPEYFTPASQLLFLLLAYNGSKSITKGEAASKLNLTNTSITRASSQLKELGLLDEYSYQNYKYMTKSSDGMDFLKKAKPYLINPVQSVIFTRASSSLARLPYAGEYALSRLSMLNEPTIQTRAVSSRQLKKMSLKEEDPEITGISDYIKVEVWKYDPLIFSENNIVDPISLYSSLSREEDERVENELEGLLEDIKWA